MRINHQASSETVDLQKDASSRRKTIQISGKTIPLSDADLLRILLADLAFRRGKTSVPIIFTNGTKVLVSEAQFYAAADQILDTIIATIT